MPSFLNNKILTWWLGFCVGFPLFITPSLSVYKGGQEDTTFSLPVGFFFIFALLLTSFIEIFKNGLLNNLYLIYLSWILVVTLIAFPALIEGDGSLLAIYLIPSFLSFSFAWAFSPREDFFIILRRLGMGFLTAVTIGAFLHLTSSFVSYGLIGAFAVRGEFSIFGLFSIYQKFIYYSTVLAIASFLALIYLHCFKRWIVWSILLTDVLLCGSREALMLVVLYLLSFGYLRSGILGIGKILFYMILMLLVLALMFLGLVEEVVIVDDLIFFKKILAIVESSNSADLTAGRLDVIDVVSSMFELTIPFIFFGSGFDTIHSILGTPHNQYVEWFLRGGIIFILGNIFFCFISIRNYFARRVDYMQYGVLLFWLMVVSNNINTPFRAPYTSIFMWLLIGFGIRLYSHPRKNFTPF